MNPKIACALFIIIGLTESIGEAEKGKKWVPPRMNPDLFPEQEFDPSSPECIPYREPCGFYSFTINGDPPLKWVKSCGFWGDIDNQPVLSENRPLAERNKEHIADIRHNQNRNGPWANQAREKHDGRQINVAVNVISIEHNVVEWKTKEALYIRKFNPGINGRTEMAEAMKFIRAI